MGETAAYSKGLLARMQEPGGPSPSLQQLSTSADSRQPEEPRCDAKALLLKLLERSVHQTKPTYPVLSPSLLDSSTASVNSTSDAMLSSQHVYSHQQQYPQQHNDWHSNPHHVAQDHVRAMPAQAAVAQQHSYGRLNPNNINGAGDHAPSPASTNQDGIMNDDNKRVLEYIAQLMSINTREAALLELSKKREQVPELALVLWHSFGK